jgi:hypothetical protein
LFGFQFAAVLTKRFAQLPGALKSIHLVSLGVVAIAVVMLIAPAAYHRIAAGGDAEESVLRYAVHMMLPAQGFLGVVQTWVTRKGELALPGRLMAR